MTMLVMLILPLVTSLYHGTQAAPSHRIVYTQPIQESTLNFGSPSNFFPRNASDPSALQCNCPDKRTLIDILWSCITTVLICTWISVHPNVPPEGEERWRSVVRRVKVMFWGLVAPELIVGWSIRQWVSARKIGKENSHRGWSQIHGFLFVMGGFSLMKGGEDLGTLSYSVFSDLLKTGDIDFPAISVADIKEKSKADPLAKALVIIQTTWFIVQCIGRAAIGLAITELEIVTLAFCSLNAIIYFFWWNKPLDIERRVPIYLKAESNYRPKPARAESLEEPSVQDAVVKSADENSREKNVITKVETENPTPPTSRFPFVQSIKNKFSPIVRAIAGYIHRIHTALREDLDYYNIFLLFLFIYPIGRPLAFVITLLAHVFDTYMIGIIAAMVGDEESENIRPGVKRVNTFYSPELQYNDDMMTSALYSIIGCAFGALHCIAWDFHFPTVVERSLWRSLSLIITFIPLCFVAVFMGSFSKDEDGEYRQHIKNKFLRGLEFAILIIIVLLVALYIPCRIILLVQSLISMRDVPHSVYLAFNWQNYIPHL